MSTDPDLDAYPSHHDQISDFSCFQKYHSFSHRYSHRVTSMVILPVQLLMYDAAKDAALFLIDLLGDWTRHERICVSFSHHIHQTNGLR
jgi:hypothetical protein